MALKVVEPEADEIVRDFIPDGLCSFLCQDGTPAGYHIIIFHELFQLASNALFSQ